MCGFFVRRFVLLDYTTFWMKMNNDNNKNNRQQLLNLGLKPFTQMLISKRAKNLCEAFPEYDEGLLHHFVESDPMVKRK